MITRATLSTIEQGLPKYRSMLAGNTAYSPGSFDSIATVSVGSGGAASATFSSIPATYTHLQLRCIARQTGAVNNGNIKVRLNNDSGGNYRTHILFGDGSAVSSFDYGSGNDGIYLNYMPGANATSGIFGAAVLDILDYTDTNKNSVVRFLQGEDRNGAGTMTFDSGLWLNTNVVNRIDLVATQGNLAEYSHFALYGIKGA